jgi:ComEC/Rec2-related protein
VVWNLFSPYVFVIGILFFLATLLGARAWSLFILFLFLGGGYGWIFGSIRVSREFFPSNAFTARIQLPPAGAYASLALLPPYRGVFRMRIPDALTVHPSDILSLHGIFLSRASLFDTPLFLPDRVTLLSRGEGLLASLSHAREKALFLFARILPGDAAALLQGITLGSTRLFSPDLSAAMRQSGTTHIVALSGSNAAIFVSGVLIMLGGVPFLLQAIGLGVLLFLFLLMTGAEPSLLRACLMSFILFVFQGKKSTLSPLMLLGSVALVMLLFDPSYARQAGFLLSFASVLGIVYLTPRVRERLLPRPGFFSWREHCAATVGAQIAVLPFLLFLFESVPLFGILANILILPFVPLLMILGLCGVALAWTIPILAFLPLWTAYPFLLYERMIIRFFGSLPGSFGAPHTVFGVVSFGFCYLFLLWRILRKP